MGDACRSDTSAAVAEFFADPDESVRLASYAAAACTGKLDVARLLTRHGFGFASGVERDLLADALSEMLVAPPTSSSSLLTTVLCRRRGRKDTRPRADHRSGWLRTLRVNRGYWRACLSYSLVRGHG